jgi:hypothetical protein
VNCSEIGFSEYSKLLEMGGGCRKKAWTGPTETRTEWNFTRALLGTLILFLQANFTFNYYYSI